jgi:hypothetical protein
VRRASTIAALVAVAGLVVVAVPPARAQRLEHVSDELALARICVSEIGFDVGRGDDLDARRECAAIASVLRARDEVIDGDLGAAMRAYSSRVFDPTRRDPRAWIAHLRLDGREPAHWPTVVIERAPEADGASRVRPHPPWAAYRALWSGALDTARAVLAGEIDHACAAAPAHWGARYGVDLERARRAGWTEIDCGETGNAFYDGVRAGGEG